MIFFNRSKVLRGRGVKLSSGNNLLHHGFQVGIFMKGMDGVLEIIGGVLLMLVNPVRLNQIVILLTQHELAEDPHDLIVNLILNASRSFSIQSEHFAVFYLLTHGAMKLILVSLLLRKKLLAYPLTIGFLILFVIFQIIRYQSGHSFWLIILTVFDLIVVLLTWFEYRRITHSRIQNHEL